MVDVHEIVQLLESGRSLADIQRDLLPQPWQRAMRVCAAAESFDGALFDEVLCRHARPDAPTLTDLAARGLVEPIDHAPDTWRVPSDDAMSWMLDWHQGWHGPGAPEELRRLEADLAGWYDAHGMPAERLRHLLVAEPAAAVVLFHRLFGEADEARDFASCNDLLGVLADPKRVTLAGPDVAELRLDRSGYLRARLYWSVDYGRSAQFLEPPGLRERTEQLLAGTGPRVWQVYAPGGTGKTMQLQWLVARHCVPAARDIPCARIDFDVLDPVNVARYPWLLLLEVADQLDRRWPRRVFEKLDQFSSYRGLTRRETSELTQTAARGMAALDLADVEEQVVGVFVRRFNAAAGDRPAVVVVDTLEEMLLSGVSGTDRLLRLLARVVRGCPALRLIVAGRYDLREPDRAPAAIAALEPVKSIRIADFSLEQADVYLRDLRGIADPALRTAVVGRTLGQPLLVALFADLIEQEPAIRPHELLHQQEPALRLLIDRVIRRIQDPDVRWLVRYGVVPRRLRYEDVATVMRPFLARGRAGPSERDDPRRDEHHLAGRDDVFPFGSAAHGDDAAQDDDAALTAAWCRLLSYAALASWVYEPAGDSGAVVFHPNVRAPMRQLVSGQPVFHDLHEAFRERFEALADSDPVGRSSHLREAVYHRVQMGDPTAVEFWHTQVVRLRDCGDLDGMEALAGDLLTDDYVEDGLPRNRADGRPLLPHTAVAEASVWVACAAVERARAVGAGASDPLWSTARLSLSRHAEMMRRAPAGTPVPRTGLAVAVQAALLTADGRSEEAAEQAVNALTAAAEDERVDLLRALGDAFAATAHAEAASVYRIAFGVSGRQGRQDQSAPIAYSLAMLSATDGRMDEAVTWCERAVALATPVAAVAARLLHATLLLRRYEPAAALRILHRPLPEPVGEAVATRLRARAYAALGRSVQTLGELDAADRLAERLPGPARYEQLARNDQLRGTVLGELLAVDEAQQAFLRATSLWDELGYAGGHPACSYLHCRFLLRDVGDLTAASRLPRVPRVTREDVALWEELAVELRQALGAPSRAMDAEAAGELFDGLPPRVAARVAAGRLAGSWDRHRHLVPGLLDALERIHPPSARLVVMEELRRCERAAAEDLRLLRPLFPQPHASPRDPDTALQLALLAELDRLAGDHAGARRKVDGAQPFDRENPLAGWRWLRARGRLQEPLDPATAGPLLDAAADYPLLRAASLYTLARLPAGGSTGSTRRLLAEARELATGPDTMPTRWAADILHAEAELARDLSLLALAEDQDHRLGRPRRDRWISGDHRISGPVNAEGPPPVLDQHPGEHVVTLQRPPFLPADIRELQYQLVEEWPRLARHLGIALAGYRPAAATGPAPAAVRLESDDLAVQALPWELALPPPGGGPDPLWTWPAEFYRSLPAASARIDTRWLQQALAARGTAMPIDGVFGPITAAELEHAAPGSSSVDADLHARLERALAAERSDQMPSVLLVRPDASVESAVSSHSDFGYDISHLYAAYGFRVRVAHGLDARLGHPTVLHLAARVDLRGAGPYFDLSAAKAPERMGAKARGTDIHPTDVARWLRGCDPGREPLVVLDPPYSGSPYDLPWQVVLRNLFAATLFAEAQAPVIVATGLHTARISYVHAIASWVRERGPLAELARALRPLYDDTPARLVDLDPTNADQYAELATAIFAAPSAIGPPA
jgi:tetratricopeptide (TPR) repeat protein